MIYLRRVFHSALKHVYKLRIWDNKFVPQIAYFVGFAVIIGWLF